MLSSGQARTIARTSALFLGEKFMQLMRQGDVTVLPLAQTVGVTIPQELRKKLPNLTLAKGEVTANQYSIGEQKAEL
jgi:hypothetical protein